MQNIAERMDVLSVEDVQNALTQTDRIIESCAADIQDKGPPEALRWLKESRHHQRKARALLKEGRLKMAFAQTKVATKLILKASEWTPIEAPPRPRE